MLFLIVAIPPAYARPVIDNDGRVILADKHFARIISLYAAHTRNLVDMGAGAQIVATGRGDRQLPDLPRLSFRDDTDRILALKPELVLICPEISRTYPQQVKRLEENGVAVVSLQPASINELFRYWQTLGSLSGHKQGANQMIAAFGANLAEIKLLVDHIPEKDRKMVYFQSNHKQMTTFAPGSIAIFVLKSAGGINAAADAVQVGTTNRAIFSRERILARAERIDLFLAQKGRMNPVTREMILKEPGFQVIRAVRNKQVFLVDEKLVSHPTLGVLDGIGKIFDILYPKVTP